MRLPSSQLEWTAVLWKYFTIQSGSVIARQTASGGASMSCIRAG